MKAKKLCEVCNREFETEEEQLEWDEAIRKYFWKEETICPDCREDVEL